MRPRPRIRDVLWLLLFALAMPMTKTCPLCGRGERR